MNQTDIYRKAIQRTFAELYSVPAELVDVAWNSEGVTARCAGMIFTHQTGDDDPEFDKEARAIGSFSKAGSFGMRAQFGRCAPPRGGRFATAPAVVCVAGFSAATFRKALSASNAPGG